MQRRVSGVGERVKLKRRVVYQNFSSHRQRQAVSCHRERETASDSVSGIAGGAPYTDD